MFVSEILKETRETAKMSLNQLAEKAETSQPTLSNYETGKKPPRYDTASRILSVFNKTLEPVIQNTKPVYVAQTLIDEIVKNKKPAVHRVQQLEDNIAILTESDLATEKLTLTGQ